MAKLEAADREISRSEWTRENREDISLSKAQVRRAIDEADDWLDDNFAVFNNALPAPIQTALTRAQKMRIIAVTALRRWQKGV